MFRNNLVIIIHFINIMIMFFQFLTLRMLETSIFTVIRASRDQMLDLFSQICHQWFMPHSSTFLLLYSIFGISLDRFISVKYPLRNQSIVTKRKVAIYIFTVWFIGIFFTILPFSYSMHLHGTMRGNITLNETSSICGEMLRFQLICKDILSLLLPIPVIGITIIYTYICVIAFRHKRALQRYKNDNQSGAVWMLTKALSNAKTAYVYIIVFALFLLGWLPLLVVTTLAQFCNDCNLRTIMTLTIPFGCITMSTSAINPWIYTLNTREFRKELNKIKILCCVLIKKLPKCKIKCVRLLRRDKYTVTEPIDSRELPSTPSRSHSENYSKKADSVADNNTPTENKPAIVDNNINS